MKFWRPGESLDVEKGCVPTFTAGSCVLLFENEASWTGLLRDLAIEW